jgi:hypothetical protein
MSKQFFLILLPAYLIHIYSWGQNNSKISNYVTSEYYSNLRPKDPEYASLGSFGKIPINYYTGLPEISLNLLTLTSRDLTVPISINYDPSGVKVNDISCAVGLKWNLSAGGYVARQLNGALPDEVASGYWGNETQINAYSTQTQSTKQTWASQCEQATNDFEPDDFYLFVNGRTIRFVFKNKVAMTIPKLNVAITYTLDASNNINSFQLIDENGTKYNFGGSTSSIEQRKVETMNMSVRENYWDYTYGGHSFNMQWYQFNPEVSITEKSGQFYNDKWYLISITSASGDNVNFNYVKDPDQIHVTMPIVTRIDFSNVGIDNYTYTTSGNSYSVQNISAYAAFGQDCLDSNPINCDFIADQSDLSLFKWPGFLDATWADPYNLHGLQPAGQFYNVTQTQTDAYIDPITNYANMGGTYVSQSLITESVIRLSGITTSVGNNIVFSTSSRLDMPSAFKYEQMKLYNMSGQLIKSIQLNYSTRDADLTQDYLWLSEGMMAARINTTKTFTQTESDGYPDDQNYDYYAHHFYQSGYFTDIDISGPFPATQKPFFPTTDYSTQYKKYTYEGLREYNFKRLYLTDIFEITNGNQKTLYSFQYNNWDKLKRRNSPLQDEYGFSFSYFDRPGYETPIAITNNNYYNLSLAAIPRGMVTKTYRPSIIDSGPTSALYGMLTQITYPTGGTTEFVFNDSNVGAISLKSVTDKDENGNPVQTRELSYLASCYTVQPQKTAIRRFPVAGSNPTKYAQLKTISNVAQNRTFRPSAGVFKTYSKVKVYNGTSSAYKGYEIFSYDDNGDCQLDAPSTIELPGGTTSTTTNDIFPFPRPTENDHKRGLLRGHDVYDKDGNLLKSTINKYTTISTAADNPQTQIGFFGASTTSFLDGSTKSYRYGTYQITNDRVYLSKTTEKIFDQALPQDLTKNSSTITEFTYDNASLQLTSTKSYNELNSGSYVSTATKYPTDADYDVTAYCLQQYNTCVAGCSGRSTCLTDCNTARTNCINGTNLTAEAKAVMALRSNHQVNSPVEIQNWIQEGATSKITSAVVYKYNIGGSSTQFVKPKEIWGLKQPLDASSYTTSKISGASSLTIDNKMRKLHQYDLYDQTSANLLQQTSLDGTVSTYTWGFNNSLVTGATVNPGSLQQTSSFVHQPGVGITQTTDPNLRNANYTYDGFNRLRTIKDHDSNIQSRYRYHYIGQNEFLNGVMSLSSCRVVNSAISFSCSDNPAFGQTTYTWDFGDGYTATGASASHAYTTVGTYTVKLKKSNPEQFASDQTQVITIAPAATAISICADGPVSIDACGVNATTFGICTTTNNSSSSPTVLKASGGLNVVSFQWQYQYNGASTWYTFGTSATTQSAPAGFGQGSVGTWVVRCVGTDSCGNQIISGSVTLRGYKSSSTCTMQ